MEKASPVLSPHLHRKTAATAVQQAPVPFFQPKLTVNQPNDVYEQEADAMADKVMRMTNHEAVHTNPAPLVVQKKCAACEAEEEVHRKEDEEDGAIQLKPIAPIQRKCAACEQKEQVHRHASGMGVPAVTPAVQQTLQSAGQSMDNGTRSFMEQRFGYDFGQVQIHNDSLAHRSSADISAHAYTHGSHIVFGAGQYQPHTSSGRQLLAHELTHVVQQNHSSIKRKEGLVQREPADKPMTRDAEIRQSMTSPGQYDFSPFTMTVSVYNFGINKHQLKKEHKKILDEVAILVKMMPPDKWDILVTGEADSTGEPELNNPLSENRANEVKKYIKRASGVSLPSLGEGEDNPVATNENVSGRTRNRRVDIHFVPKFKPIPPPPPKPCEKEPCEKPKKLCEKYPYLPILCKSSDFDCTGSIFEAMICMLFTCLIEPLAAICKCLETPALCFCLQFPSLCTPKSKKKLRACPIEVDLPTGRLPIYEEWAFLQLKDGVRMGINFKEDPEEGCACKCGEFKQNVRGFTEIEYEDGTVKRDKKALTPGIWLEEKVFHEDGDRTANSEYGHRSHRPRTDNGKGQPDDRFLPDQASGCRYKGSDMPGFTSPFASYPEVRRTIFFEFEGGPVDTCTVPGVRTEMRSYWHRWEVKGEIRKPPPPKGPGGGTPGGGTGPRKRVRVTGRKAPATSGTPSGAYYGGGISPTAKKGDVYTLSIDFDVPGRDEVFTYDVKVTVIGADADTVTIRTENAYDVNIAPPGTPDVFLKTHKTITLKRDILK